MNMMNDPSATGRSICSGESIALPHTTIHAALNAVFEKQSDKIAVRSAEGELTYEELGYRVYSYIREFDRLGIASRQCIGLRMNRSSDWIAAMLAIIRSNRIYVPIDPQLPHDRVNHIVTKADIRLVVTDVEKRMALDIPTLVANDIEVSKERLVLPDVSAPFDTAYIIFTSGTTGMPKGAQVHHIGMMNHLYAKVSLLSVSERDVLAQMAPIGFDISVWQVLCPLLAGGTVALLSETAVRSVSSCCREFRSLGVSIAEMVPSYLRGLLRLIEAAGADLGELRVLVMTGEALPAGLIDRWFAAVKNIQLVNAYGPTEASDDIAHDFFDAPTTRPEVSIGLPLQNTTLIVVNEDGDTVLRGEVGELLVQGICVGNGYINDDTRTGASFFVVDGQPAGQQYGQYKTGDQVRMESDGRLYFLGRNDDQVKIAGNRIELLDISNTLLRIPGVADAVACVFSRGEVAQLAAIYVGDCSEREMLDQCRTFLPPSMVPAIALRITALPLNANGKTDKRACQALLTATIQ